MNLLLTKLFVGRQEGNNSFVNVIDTMEGITEVINPTVVNSVLIVFALCVFIIWSSSKIKKADPSKPSSGIVLIFELVVSTVESLVTQTMGAKHLSFAPYIGTLAIYLVFANLSGLIGLTPPTSDYNVTLALALMTIVLMIGSGIRSKGVGRYLYDTYLGDFPFLLPLNITGELAKPISLSARLFGNILSGGIIMSLVYQALGIFSPLVAPFLHGYFDIFAGAIQTLIFIMLTMIWTSGAMD
ncbi:MAG: F0F1 ATP synthase subunit A [Turicibacter sp.]